MEARFVLVLCASALLVQNITAYAGCGCGLGASRGIAGAELASAKNYGGWGYAAPAIASSSGGAFGVSLASPYPPRGITVLSENSIDGALEVFGNLPVLAAVAFDGTVPSSGAAGTSHSCGGNVGISSESLAAVGLGTKLAGAEFAGIKAGLAGARFAAPAPGCGCSGY